MLRCQRHMLRLSEAHAALRRVGGHVVEAADLVEKVKSFAKRYPNSRTAHGISSMFVRQEEKLKSKLMELGLTVDSVDGVDGRSFRATEVSIAHDRSFKLRAKRGPWGKGGSLAELSQLLALGGMSTAEIAQIYRFL
uniref:Uncharacterized protein n=2 Tax=Guillardia theta (strain CCMP2712) TaxID=905079 RepID=A0A0C3SRZ3_GUITC